MGVGASKVVRRCGAVLHWRQYQGMLLWNEEHGFEAQCPSCGAVLHQVRSPKLGQKCLAMVPR